jgi:hypothetical protein
MIALIVMEFIAKNIGKIALCMLIYLVVFDVVGVLVAWFLDVIMEVDTAVLYAVWFVLAVFCGMLSYSSAADLATPKTPENSRKAGLLAVLATFVMVAVISIASYLIWWRKGLEESSFLPGSEPLTLTFFLTVLFSCMFAHKALGPTPVRKARS